MFSLKIQVVVGAPLEKSPEATGPSVSRAIPVTAIKYR